MIDLFITIMQKFSWILIVVILLFGWNSPALMILTFVCMTAPIAFSFYYGRAWCSICPMGTAAYFITRFRGRAGGNVKISENCVSCGICKGVCPVEIDIAKYKSYGEVNNADCMKCRKCIRNCRQNALSWSE